MYKISKLKLRIQIFYQKIQISLMNFDRVMPVELRKKKNKSSVQTNVKTNCGIQKSGSLGNTSDFWTIGAISVHLVKFI